MRAPSQRTPRRLRAKPVSRGECYRDMRDPRLHYTAVGYTAETLTVVELADSRSPGALAWVERSSLTRCDCGNVKHTRMELLR